MRRWRTHLVVVLGLALLAGAVAAGTEWADGRKRSVTVLGNWTGADQERFEKEVLEPFEEEHGIRVVYQGSSAESQVLAADVASGTPPTWSSCRAPANSRRTRPRAASSPWTACSTRTTTTPCGCPS
ncbi:hypothetical protein LUX05_13785 [Streptomyces somaliensis]|uniref:hypothetical protein n=1 Tax=Streptomyces somaliensis TaxID=78355 RepID=UPI0034E95243|nr:hypothetical protein [Streptomyces somaliensis]MCP9974995.1 hypothetical protein [Streptomyces somaliensis]